MAPCEGCALRSGDWCLRLSWPGTPVTSFRWGRVITINVSPGGAASPARRDTPHRPPATPHADNRALDPSPAHPTVLLSLLVHRQVSRASSRTHLRLRVRSLRVQTASLQMRPQPLDTLIQLTITHEGDIPRGRVRVLPGGGIRRRRGQQSRPHTRETSPAGRKCPRTRRMPPHASELSETRRTLVVSNAARLPLSRWHRRPRMATDSTTTADTTVIRAALRTIVTIGDS